VAKPAVRGSFENAGSAEFAAVHALRGCRIHTTIYYNTSIIFISHLFFLIWGGGGQKADGICGDGSRFHVFLPWAEKSSMHKMVIIINTNES
jgi:hypothetical protein